MGVPPPRVRCPRPFRVCVLHKGDEITANRLGFRQYALVVAKHVPPVHSQGAHVICPYHRKYVLPSVWHGPRMLLSSSAEA